MKNWKIYQDSTFPFGKAPALMGYKGESHLDAGFTYTSNRIVDQPLDIEKFNLIDAIGSLDGCAVRLRYQLPFFPLRAGSLVMYPPGQGNRVSSVASSVAKDLGRGEIWTEGGVMVGEINYATGALDLDPEFAKAQPLLLGYDYYA